MYVGSIHFIEHARTHARPHARKLIQRMTSSVENPLFNKGNICLAESNYELLINRYIYLYSYTSVSHRNNVGIRKLGLEYFRYQYKCFRSRSTGHALDPTLTLNRVPPGSNDTITPLATGLHSLTFWTLVRVFCYAIGSTTFSRHEQWSCVLFGRVVIFE